MLLQWVIDVAFCCRCCCATAAVASSCRNDKCSSDKLAGKLCPLLLLLVIGAFAW